MSLSCWDSASLLASPLTVASRSPSLLSNADGPYGAIARKVDAMLASAVHISSETLVRRAREHLDLLDLDRYATYNRPNCFDEIIRASPYESSNFNVKRLLDTMLRVTDELQMTSAKRYVSAAICACASDDGELDAVPEERSRAQVARLSYLAVVWIAYSLWPFVANTGTRMPVSTSVHDVDRTTTQVMLRDNFTCCLSGLIDRKVVLDARGKGCKALHIGIDLVNIFQGVDGSHRTKTESLATTIELFQQLYECPPIIADEIQANAPQNRFLAHLFAHEGLSCFNACLKPTEVPHRYCTLVYEPIPMVESGHYVDFKDHTQLEFATRFWPSEYSRWATEAQPDRSIRGVPLPDPALMRGRAAMTMILHESGIFRELDMLRFPADEEEIPEADGDSLMQHLRELGYDGSWIC